MNNSSEREFENTWRNQFENAAVEPDEKVWAKIDAELAHNKADTYKKRAIFFKLLAAASLIFAIGVGYYNFYYPHTETNSSGIPGKNQTDLQGRRPSTIQPDSASGLPNAVNGNAALTDVKRTQNSTPGRVIKTEPSEKVLSTNQIIAPKQVTEIGERDIYIVSRKNLPDREAPYKPNYPGFKGMDIFDPLIYTRDPGVKEMWAGIDMASGLFDPNITYGSRTALFDSRFASADNAAPNQVPNGNTYFDPERPDYSPNISYSYGINMGARVSNRWVLTGGIGYQNSKSSTTVNKYIESVDKTMRFALMSNGADIYEMNGINTLNTAKTKIEYNSYFEFISIPVSTGYILVDHNLKWLINGGISTEIFLKNSLSDPDHFLNEVKIYADSQSPYNSMLFSGTLGTSLYLPFLKNYQAVLYPSYKFGLNYLTRENSSFNSRPSSFMVNAGVSYIFK